MQKFTQEQLMLYVYQQASPILKMAIDRVIKEDALVAEEVKLIKQSKKELDKAGKDGLMSPSSLSLNKIMQYAKKAKS
ncbi:MAG: hypothetical protein WCP65_04430 [Bacteroidota bacterium]|jgi:hypothetical protein